MIFSLSNTSETCENNEVIPYFYGDFYLLWCSLWTTIAMNGGMLENENMGEVALIAEELSRAVELTLNVSVTQDDRCQAYNACESFKENSPWCAQAGLLLSSGGQFSAVVKHFGLQLLEHTVKYRWTQITQAEKIFIKENAMKLLYMGGWSIAHLNDGLARVIVEMIKREWPQQWPTLLAELSDACSQGHSHTQIVLHVFLRLVEDVATLQTLEQNQRRKDIYQALTSNMAEIFAFFMRLIELHVQEFREKTATGDYAGATSNGRVVQVVLLTMTGFVEWVSMVHVVANNGRLLQILCILLQDESFRIPAAECLLQIVNRKGSVKERKPLVILFSEDAISCIYRAALAAINSVEESLYLFLKKLSQVLIGLSQQLAMLWPHTSQQETWLPALLETLLLLTSHPSLTLTHATTAFWLTLFKHDHISKQPQLIAVIPRWLQACAPKVLKVSYPSTRTCNRHDAVTYACMDYDCEQDFAIFFVRCRSDILDSFRYCMTADPLVTWAYVDQWTDAALDKVDMGPTNLPNDHPLYVEWEALSLVLDVVLSRLLVTGPRADVAGGLRLLQRCVSCSPRSPQLCSILLSLISALFVFLSCASSQRPGPGVNSAGAELLPRVLDKVFAALVYDCPDPELQGSRVVKNVRRHAAGLLVKLASKYPLLLLPVFARIHSAANTVLARPELGALANVTLQEALLLIANHFCDYRRQSALVAEVLGDCRSRWEALAPHLQSPEGLARLIGLDSAPSLVEDERGEARRTLIHALTLLLGVVKRSLIPDDPDKASRGGFSGGVTPSGNPIWRNPCSSHVLPLLPHVLALLRALHSLHSAASKHLLHAGHSKALNLPAAEQHNLLGLREESAASAPAERMQIYVHTLHESICQMLGSAATTLGRELCAVPGLAAALEDSLLHSLPTLPDYRLRAIVRGALRPLLHHTPSAHHVDLAAPLLGRLAPAMLQHLSARWEHINSLHKTGDLEDDTISDTQELLEDVLVRVLTREYLELLKICLLGVPLTAEVTGDMEEDGSNVRNNDTLSDLGLLLLNSTRAGPALLHTIFLALTWNDSTVCLRACGVAVCVVRAWGRAAWGGPADACGALAAVLHALTAHGQHDANRAALLALAVQTYESLRPHFPAVADVLREIPDVDARDLKRLDERAPAAAASAAPAKPNKVDKSKRELFRKITSPLIGRNVSQMFKKEVFIVDLPSMPVPDRARPASDVVGLARLFTGNTDPH